MKVHIKYKRSDFHLPPAIFYSVTSDKTYLVGGNLWVEIPNDTEFEDIAYLSEDESLEDFLWEWFED